MSTKRESLIAPGRVALVTGASSGIGEAFARALGARGVRLVLTGRDEEHLGRIAAEIASTSKVRVDHVSIDLTQPDGPHQLKAAVDGFDLAPDILINNAGTSNIGTFSQLPIEAQLDTIRLNVDALVTLTGLFLPAMLANGRGGIINTSSAAGLQPLPHYAVYGATKAFVNSFSQALWGEVSVQGIRVVALCPGPVSGTRFGERAGGSSLHKIPFLASKRRMPREQVVALALRSLERNDPLIVTGLTNRLLSGVATTVPVWLQLRVTERIFRPSGAAQLRPGGGAA